MTARGRAYTVGGERVPSVTTVLRWAGFRPPDGIPPTVLENARSRGVAVHAWIDAINKGHVGFDATAPEEIEPFIAGYRGFVAAYGWVPLETELQVHNMQHRYAGTLDARGLLEGQEFGAVVDFKATAKIEPYARLQLSGYEGCLTNSHERMVVQLGKGKLGYVVEKYDDHETDWHDWLALVRAAHFKLRHGIVSL